MKIGIDARMLGYSGIGRYAENLIRELAKIDKKNQYIIFLQKRKIKSEIRNPKFETNHNLQILNSKNCKIIETDAPIYSIKEQSNFWRTVVKQKLDIMHFTHFNVPVLYRRPYVVTIHDLTPLYFPGKKRKSILEKKAYKFVLKNALKRAQKIIAVSKFTKSDILKNFPFINDKKIEVIYEGAGATAAVKLKTKILNSKFLIPNSYLLYVGVWREHKNILGLIRAFEKLKKTTKLVIVGKPDPYYREVEEAAEKSKFKKDIILTGYVSDEKLDTIYQNATAFVFPSFYEGFGLPPLEAMAKNVPVLSSNTSSLPEILGDAALYFNPRDEKDMVDKIKKILDDKKLRNDLIEKGKKRVLKYSWKECAEKTLRVYNSLMTNFKITNE